MFVQQCDIVGLHFDKICNHVNIGKALPNASYYASIVIIVSEPCATKSSQ